MEMNNFDVDIVRRTKELIETYNGPNEVTLLLNCMLSLVGLPTERTGRNEIAFKDTVVKKLNQMDVIVTSTDNDKTFRTVKNALAHVHITINNNDGIIESICLKDKKPGNKKYHTEMNFKAEQLKEFALFVADEYLKRIQAKP